MIFNKSLVLTEKNKKVIGQLIVLLTAFWESSIQFDLVFEQRFGFDTETYCGAFSRIFDGAFFERS